MDWRSLALRDEAMALCDPAVDMVLWKLAPINDILDNAVCTNAILVLGPRRVLQPSSGLVSRKGFAVVRSSETKCQRQNLQAT